MADTMGTSAAAEKWGYPPRTISEWCRKGLIEGASQDGPRKPWHIPTDAECPKPIKHKDDDQKG